MSRILGSNRSWVGAALIALALQPMAAAQVMSPETNQGGASSRFATFPIRPETLNASVSNLELPPLHPILPEATPQTRLIINLGERRVYVYRDDVLQTSYPVAIGRQGWETPTGEFQVMSMLENPGWTHPFTGEIVPPGPTNPLGERWIAFWTDGTNYIGFHGTPNRETVGQAASHGCVRMLNEHVRELYEIVEVGTSVVVEP